MQGRGIPWRGPGVASEASTPYIEGYLGLIKFM